MKLTGKVIKIGNLYDYCRYIPNKRMVDYSEVFVLNLKDEYVIIKNRGISKDNWIETASKKDFVEVNKSEFNWNMSVNEFSNENVLLNV
jgi:hypothetical protein